MSTMSTEADFAEGSIDLSETAVWFCTVHEATLKAGQDCMFCVHDQLGDVEFERWLQRAS
jgi:hypothetical protein